MNLFSFFRALYQSLTLTPPPVGKKIPEQCGGKRTNFYAYVSSLKGGYKSFSSAFTPAKTNLSCAIATIFLYGLFCCISIPFNFYSPFFSGPSILVNSEFRLPINSFSTLENHPCAFWKGERPHPCLGDIFRGLVLMLGFRGGLERKESKDFLASIIREICFSLSWFFFSIPHVSPGKMNWCGSYTHKMRKACVMRVHAGIQGIFILFSLQKISDLFF